MLFVCALDVVGAVGDDFLQPASTAAAVEHNAEEEDTAPARAAVEYDHCPEAFIHMSVTTTST